MVLHSVLSRFGWGATLALLGLAGCGSEAEEVPATRENPEPLRLTTHAAEDRSPAWSPAGDRLLFASDRSGNWEIYSIQPDGEGLERLTDHPASGQSPAWAPSGAEFVFQSDRGGEAGLWIMALGASEPSLLVRDSSPELVPDWSPDGRWIAFTSKRDGNTELYRVSVESGEVERLTDEPYRDVWPRYFPDGESLVFFSRRASEGQFDDLFRLDLGSGDVERITSHPSHHDFVPDISPDGRRIVAGMSDREAGVRSLSVLDLDGEVLHRIGTGYHRVFQPAWSPDGSRIVYAARVADGENADLFVIPAPQ